MAKATTRTVSFSGKIETFDGQDVETVLGRQLTYSGKVKQYIKDAPGVLDAIRLASDFPKDEDIITAVNAKLKAKERAKIIASTLKDAGLSKPEAGSCEAFYRDMVSTLKGAGKSEEQAAMLAEQALGYNLEQAREKDAAKKAEEEGTEEAEETEVSA